jgi:CBS domain-containing protein
MASALPPVTEDVEPYELDEQEPLGRMLDSPIGKVPRREALLVSRGTSVAEVIRQMNERGVGCALVVDGERLAGIFTERDVLKKIAGKHPGLDALPVAEVMTADPDTLPSNASVAFALNRMVVEGYRHIPLVDERGRPQSVLSMRDVIGWMVELYPNRVLNVPPTPDSFPRTPSGG